MGQASLVPSAYKFIRWFSTEGIGVQGLSLPGWRKADQSKVVDTFIAGTEKQFLTNN
ncbi:hypothetical protein [Paenibacillus sp. N3.4]|uniref:hypothetical protein n=1 Tax=Paenibacillus sp. N3.4 TaxID=2603222 RepID=UPI00164F1D99|nr:hypothetical protein [Paenibacillus sp. N3.4]